MGRLGTPLSGLKGLKMARKDTLLKYNHSEKGKAARKRYSETDKHKEWRKAFNKTPQGKAILAKASRKLHDKRRAILQEEKLKRGCIDCGYNKHHAALDFDHVSGEKCFELSKSVSRTIESMMAEMAKCVVRCSNCHRIKTFEQRQMAHDKKRIKGTIDAKIPQDFGQFAPGDADSDSFVNSSQTSGSAD